MSKKSPEKPAANNIGSFTKLFSEIRREVLKLDPVSFAENFLKIDGTDPFSVSKEWKFMADIYRYIATQAIKLDGKPVVILKGRQVGATMMAAALDLYFTASGLFGQHNAPFRVLHCFPELAHVKRFSQDKLESLIRTSTGDFINRQKLGYNLKTKRVSDAKIPDNMTLKQFSGGCNLWIESIGIDGDRVRGMTVDAIYFDEVQDMSKQAIGAATKLLTAAKYGPRGVGVQVYFGTPKEKGSYFEKGLWDQSDKRYYHLGCANTKCNEFFLLYTPGSDDWEKKIWVRGFIVKCPYCNLEQDKIQGIINGKWIATEPTDHNGKEKQYVGFHINQLYIPNFSKENIMRLMPNGNSSQSERVYFNEVLGEFYSGLGMPITKEEILEKCMDKERGFSRGILPTQRKTWLGLDWGGKTDADNSAGQSYSCAVVISANSQGIIDVEFAYKLKKTDYEYQIDFVRTMFRKYGVRIGAADLMYGQHVVPALQKIYGDKFLAAQSLGTMKANVNYDKEQILLKWSKDYYIEELYDLMRKGKIRFPQKSYENMSWLIDHITSMESDNKYTNGIMRKSFKKGSDPNDGFMALIHAYLAYKFEMTRGFNLNLNNPNQTSNSISNLLPILARVPRMR